MYIIASARAEKQYICQRRAMGADALTRVRNYCLDSTDKAQSKVAKVISDALDKSRNLVMIDAPWVRPGRFDSSNRAVPSNVKFEEVNIKVKLQQRNTAEGSG